MITLTPDIIKKFNTSGPRYTSYPTAPNWNEARDSGNYLNALKKLDESQNPISIYIHIPFCEKMCLYCGCSVTIRKANPQVGDNYLDHLFKEIDLFSTQLNYTPKVKQIHLGGGTPNYLTPDQNSRLMLKLRSTFKVLEDAEISVELDPRIIDINYLHHLRKIGFNRVSMGIQDFDLKVQEAVNRVQPYEMVEPIIKEVQRLKFESINLDLIYGLPHQSAASFQDTISKVIDLNPDRIALYSFAFIPWLKSHQGLLKEDDFPSDDEKINLFLSASRQFSDADYISIAMDHFAKKDDELATAFASGTLYRNFMGYTIMPTEDFIGFGLTSIGFIQNHYFQNIKDIRQYYNAVTIGQHPIIREKVLNQDDIIRQYVINSLMCKFKLDTKELEERFQINFNEYFKDEKDHLQFCVDEDLLHVETNSNISTANATKTNPTIYTVTDLGKLFVRNICMGVDAYYNPSDTKQKFSKTI